MSRRGPAFVLSWRMLDRDWRSGELNTLLFALIVAVSSMHTVGFSMDRVEQGLTRQAAQQMAADLVVLSSRPIRPALVDLAREEGAATSRVMEFRSVVLAGDRPRLAEVKAEGPGYPLRGRLRTAPGIVEEGTGTAGVPASGEVWVEPRLIRELGLEMGEAIHLGMRSFRVARVLTTNRTGVAISSAWRPG